MDNLLKIRNTAEKDLLEKMRQVERYLGGDNICSRLLQRKIDRLVIARDDFVFKHQAYIESLSDTMENTYEITGILDNAEDLFDSASLKIFEMDTNILSTNEIDEQNKNREKAFKEISFQVETDEIFIKKSILSILKRIDDSETKPEDIRIVNSTLKTIYGCADSLIESWKKYISLMPATANEEDISNQKDRNNKMRIWIYENCAKAEAYIGAISGDSLNSHPQNTTTHKTGYTGSTKLEKMKLPVFGGNIRNFARFKADFKAIVEMNYTDLTHQIYVLKETCLKGAAKSLIENLNDINDIWNRLEERYGDNSEIINVIIRDIEKFEIPKNNTDQGLVDLVNLLEKGLQDLSAISAQKEIANAFTVKMLEYKLPRNVMTRWLNLDKTSCSTDKFENLFTFLKQERKMMERFLQMRKQDTKSEDTGKPNKKYVNTANNSSSGSNKYNNNCVIHPNAGHLTRKCRTFLAQKVSERNKTIKEANACELCLSIAHIGKECPFIEKWGPCGINECKVKHSRLLHDKAFNGKVTTPPNNNVLLLMECIESNMGLINSFWDSGSTINLISKDFVIKNKMHGTKVSYELCTVGGNMEVHNTYLHELKLIDRSGLVHEIKAFQIDEICNDCNSVDIRGVMHLFPNLKYNDVSRNYNSVELLIGMQHAKIHPLPAEVKGELILYNSLFGSGKILGGFHSEVYTHNKLNAFAQFVAKAVHQNVRIVRNKPENPGIDFFTAEQFGVSVPARCKKCLDCKICRFNTHQLSLVEQMELDTIKNNLELDPINNQWITTYPYKRDPSILDDNKNQALALLYRTEKRLSRSKICANKYCEQFDDFVSRGIFTKISDEELATYNGPRFYVTHHEVYKPDSSSTPVRLVINSSLKYNNVSLNDLLMKGPNTLNELFGIQLRFRMHTFALVGDIRKMYHSIKTTEKEKHIRRILWRNLDETQEPSVYGITAVTFGDKPAAAISAVAIQETARIYESYDQKASSKIIHDSYVDDIVTGDQTETDLKVLKIKITEILKKGGFEIKGFVSTGDYSDDALSLLGSGEIGRVLGIGWLPKSDEFVLSVKINISKKYRGARTEEDLSYEQIPQILQENLTRRILLGVVNSCYDPLGLLSPITIQLKIELRKFNNSYSGLDWDDPISADARNRWIYLLKLLKEAEGIRFPRCVKPHNSVGLPTLIIFNDGSNDAMAAVVYIRWKLISGEFECKLLLAKTRVTPIIKLTIPRIEMQSAVMGSRLRKSVVNHLNSEYEEIIHILDSQCTLATLHKSSLALKEFMGNRVSEILQITKTTEWYHVNSHNNAADLPTRSNASIQNVTNESEWQKGPSWLKLDRECWPISQDFGKNTTPENELSGFSAGTHITTSEYCTINLETLKNKSYLFVTRVVAIVLKVARQRSFCTKLIDSTDIQAAEKFILKESMMHTKQHYIDGKLTSLRPKYIDGIISIGGRASIGFKAHYGISELPILINTDPLAYIWMKTCHNENHTGITQTVAKSRRKFWIVRARTLAQKIVRSCFKCRLIDKHVSEQLMAPLPPERLMMSPTFYRISLDLFGPFLIKDTVRQRVHKKVWGIVFSCFSTRAMHLDITEGYDTDSFLIVLRKFVTLRGCPIQIVSDQGSQLVAAAGEVADLMREWDWSKVHTWATNNKIEWKFVPAEGQHQNGISESLIKSVKRTMKHVIGSSILTFSELQLYFYEISNIINSRPIGIISGSDPDQPTPITPNDLILGRATSEIPQGSFDHGRSISRRFRHVQLLIDNWWSRWYETVLPSLVPSYKWLVKHRNLKIGDVCLIKYGKEKRAEYRLGRIVETKTSSDGMIRRVTLKYRLPNEKTFRHVERSIQSLVVIVPVEEQSNSIICDQTKLNPLASEFTPSV